MDELVESSVRFVKEKYPAFWLAEDGLISQSGAGVLRLSLWTRENFHSILITLLWLS